MVQQLIPIYHYTGPKTHGLATYTNYKLIQIMKQRMPIMQQLTSIKQQPAPIVQQLLKIAKQTTIYTHEAARCTNQSIPLRIRRLWLNLSI